MRAPLTLDELPLAELLLYVGDNLLPNGDQFLQQSSVGPTALSAAAEALFPKLATPGAKMAFGAGVVTWPGGTRFSNASTVAHGLSVTPSNIQLTPADQNVHVSQFPGAPGAGTFTVTGNTVDGTSPTAATAFGFYWIAIG